MREIVIEKAGQRLDKFLAKYMNEASKSFFYKMMRKKNITLNGKRCEGNEKLAEGDVVKLFLAEDTIEKFSSVQVQEVKKVDLDILYEDDEIILVNKPAGMLSVPGKGDADSVYHRLHILYPDATGPIIVHRLDMATSGLLLAAKTKEAHQNLQAQFKNRTIQKRYIALLEGEVPQDEGEIRLPLCPDPLDRPRQIVSEEFGKPAFTRYRVLERTSGKTLIAFYPQTGRTHQLRVHAAHPLGLHCPILGDELYGRKAERLYLHAEYLAFTHPITFERIEIRAKIPFSQH